MVTAPASATAGEDTPLDLSGFNLVDVNSGTTPITVTLTVSDRSDGQFLNGILTIKEVAGGVTSAQVVDNFTSVVTITAPVAQIAATLSNPSGWSYTPPSNFAGNTVNPKWEILTVTADDGGATGLTSPGGTTDTRQVTLYVNEVNDAPLVTVPGPAAVDEDVVLNVSGLGNIEVTDADAGNAVVSVQLSVGRGTITVDTTVVGGPLITGNGTSQVVLSGPADRHQQVARFVRELPRLLEYHRPGCLDHSGQ